MRTYIDQRGKTHHIGENGLCMEHGVKHKIPCQRKWDHQHPIEGQTIVVWGPKREWNVLTRDDGSICSRYVTPVPPRPLGLPGQTVAEMPRPVSDPEFTKKWADRRARARRIAEGRR
jgi:hypothetical protein